MYEIKKKHSGTRNIPEERTQKKLFESEGGAMEEKGYDASQTLGLLPFDLPKGRVLTLRRTAILDPGSSTVRI